MPYNAKTDTVARQWEILKMLPARGAGRTASEITTKLSQSGHGVSKRTVERDLNLLSSVFAIECNDLSMPWGWRFTPGLEPDLPNMALPEALTLVLAESVVRPAVPKALLEPLDGRFRRAHERLKGQGRSPYRRWKSVFRRVAETGPLRPPVIPQGILECIQEALMNGKRMSGSYRAAGQDRAGPLDVNPLGLVQKGPVFYVVATVFGYDDVRLLAAHRFEALSIENRASRRPKGFTLDAYLKSGAMGFGAEGEIEFKAEVSEHIVNYLEERPLSKNQKIEPKGNCFVVTAKVPWTWDLEYWILGQGPEIQVLEPAALRESISESIRKSYEKNCKPTL